MYTVSIVLGLGFGDEGKGLTVNSLCKNPKDTTVVRFNGGHQCGHTVVDGKYRHVFSSFGSATLKGAPTYISEFCTVDPVGIWNEGNLLRENGYKPMLFINENAMITTPYDIYRNLQDEKTKEHGTVGVGFGATIQRNEDHYRLFVRDLKFPDIRDEKLEMIRKYVFQRMGESMLQDIKRDLIITFKNACDNLVERYKIVNSMIYTPNLHGDMIFEGGQGIMLDQDYGFFPHVTRSNTTSKNALEILRNLNVHSNRIITYYVTRAYATRHGNGYLPNEKLENAPKIEINPLETNVDTGAQGIFRRAILDMDTLKYAIACDQFHQHTMDRVLVMTCTNHINSRLIPITIKEKIHYLSPEEIAKELGFYYVITSDSDTGFDYEQVKKHF